MAVDINKASLKLFPFHKNMIYRVSHAFDSNI